MSKEEYLHSIRRRIERLDDIYEGITTYLIGELSKGDNCTDAVVGNFDYKDCIYIVADGGERESVKKRLGEREVRKIITFNECRRERMLGMSYPLLVSHRALMKFMSRSLALGELRVASKLNKIGFFQRLKFLFGGEINDLVSFDIEAI